MTTKWWAQLVPLDMEGCICHFVKWQIHSFISKGTNYAALLMVPARGLPDDVISVVPPLYAFAEVIV